MARSKVAVTIDGDLLREVDRWVRSGEFASRSGAFQAALARLREDRGRRESLLIELAKLNANEERALAEEWQPGEVDWTRP